MKISVRIELLGGLRISSAGRELPLPESRRSRLLLAWLALNPGRHSRSRLASVLRPDGCDDEARRTLRQSCWHLSRALSCAAAGVLDSGRTHVGLNADCVAVDVAELRARAAAGDLTAARALRTRPLLPEHDPDWVLDARETLRHDVAELSARNAAGYEEQGDLHQAVAWARERAFADPLSELVQRELMRLLALQGDRAAAVGVATDLRRRLNDELGLVPSAATRVAIEDLLSDDDPVVLTATRQPVTVYSTTWFNSAEDQEPAVSTQTSIVTGVDFVHVPTQNFDAAFEFYGTVLGLECTAQYGRTPGAEFETGNLTLQLMDQATIGREFVPNSQPIAFRVDDVKAARAELEARGVTFQGDGIDSGVCHMAFFTDPDGNALMLHHRYAPKSPQG